MNNHAGGCKLTKTCKALGKRSAVRVKYQKPGAICRRTTFNPDALWVKHGTWKAERSTMPFGRGPKVAPMGNHGLVIRKKTKI